MGYMYESVVLFFWNKNLLPSDEGIHYKKMNKNLHFDQKNPIRSIEFAEILSEVAKSVFAVFWVGGMSNESS